MDEYLSRGGNFRECWEWIVGTEMVAGSNRMLSDVMSVGVFVHPKKKTDKPETISRIALVFPIQKCWKEADC